MAFGAPEWIIIGVVVILLFGGAALPKLARALGRAQGEFKKAKGEMDREMRSAEVDTGPSEEQIRKTARDLGIAESGVALDEVKRRINEKMA